LRFTNFKGIQTGGFKSGLSLTCLKTPLRILFDYAGEPTYGSMPSLRIRGRPIGSEYKRELVGGLSLPGIIRAGYGLVVIWVRLAV
jgi:hypothetical protein